MNCKKVLSRLPAYLDGELSATLMREMEEHLDGCRSCHIQAGHIRRMEVLLDSLTVPPIPQEFASRTMAEARRRARPAAEKRLFPGVDWLPLRWFAELTIPMRLAACAMVLLASLLGMFMSKDLSVSGGLGTAVAATENLDGLEWFSPSPPTSLGSAYLTLALTIPEDQGTR